MFQVTMRVAPLRARQVILADGRRDRRLLGEAVLTIPPLNESLTCPVVFGPPGSPYLLGATALEHFGVQADSTTRQLRTVAAVIGGFLGSTIPPVRPVGPALTRTARPASVFAALPR